MKGREQMRVIYAGNRDIGVWALQFILEQGVRPLALLVPSDPESGDVKELRRLCGHLEDRYVLVGTSFRTPEGVELLRSLEPDYIVCVHFPYIVPPEVLSIPKIGVVNLHPAYLPYNRGWHTPSWAILEGTPYGATLHFMSEEVDAGDIIHQKPIDVRPEDTADSLYRRVKRLELEVFKEAWPMLMTKNPPRYPQDLSRGTYHRRQDLRSVQRIDLGEACRAGDLITRLRALTTNRVDEAAYFETGGHRYRIQVTIIKET